MGTGYRLIVIKELHADWLSNFSVLAIKSEGSIKGAHANNKVTLEQSANELFSISYLRTSTIGVTSSDNAEGRPGLVGTPKLVAKFATSESSVETIILSKMFAFKAHSILY
jgi:hypothetical protein